MIWSQTASGVLPSDNDLLTLSHLVSVSAGMRTIRGVARAPPTEPRRPTTLESRIETLPAHVVSLFGIRHGFSLRQGPITTQAAKDRDLEHGLRLTQLSALGRTPSLDAKHVSGVGQPRRIEGPVVQCKGDDNYVGTEDQLLGEGEVEGDLGICQQTEARLASL